MQPNLDDAPTPVGGTPVANLRRLPTRVRRRFRPLAGNRRNLLIVLAFCLLLALALALFLWLAGDPVTENAGSATTRL